MKYLTLADNIPSVSAIGVGCMRLSGKTKQEVQQLVETSLANGINFFDHADIYGGGRCEQLFGEVLKDDPSLRSQIVIQSKCAIRQGQYDFSKEYILQSVDGILTRLNTDYLDSLLLHRPDVLMEPDQVGEAFRELYQSGKVRSFGVSNMNRFQMELLQSGLDYPISADQLQLSLAHCPLIDEGFGVNTDWQTGVVRNSGTLEYLKLNRIVLQTWSPLQFGMFRGTFLDHEDFRELNDLLEKLAQQYGVGKDTIAYSWLLRLPQKVQVITGTTNPEHIASAAKATEVCLSAKEWYELYLATGKQLP